MGKSPKSKQGKKPELTEVHLADVINFHELFRIKGKKHLWTMRSNPNSAGMLGMIEFMNYDQRCVVNRREIVSLGHLLFYTLAGHNDLKFRDVFRNLYDAEAEKESFNDLSVQEQMEIAVPCFDEDLFRPYHMQQLLEWYRELFKKLRDAEAKNKNRDKKTDDSEGVRNET